MDDILNIYHNAWKCCYKMLENRKYIFDDNKADIDFESFKLLYINDKILAMDLKHGGHLTHGSSANFSGKFYNLTKSGVDKETELLDMDNIRKLAQKEKPKLIISGYTAYPRKIDFKEFHQIAEEVGAYSMADISHIAGLIVGNVHL